MTPKVDGMWICDICGRFAEYHRCIDGHEYYCFDHWAQGDFTKKQILALTGDDDKDGD